MPAAWQAATPWATHWQKKCMCWETCACAVVVFMRMEHRVTVGVYKQQWDWKLFVGCSKWGKSLIVKHFGFRQPQTSEYLTPMFLWNWGRRYLKLDFTLITCLRNMGIADTTHSSPVAGRGSPWEKLYCIWAATEPLCLERLQKSSSCTWHRAIKNRDGNHFQRPHTLAPKAGLKYFYPISNRYLSKLIPLLPIPSLLSQGIIENIPCPQMDPFLSCQCWTLFSKRGTRSCWGVFEFSNSLLPFLPLSSGYGELQRAEQLGKSPRVVTA